MGTGTKYWKPIFLQESVTPFNPIEYQSESIGNYMYQKEAYLLLHLAVFGRTKCNIVHTYCTF